MTKTRCAAAITGCLVSLILAAAPAAQARREPGLKSGPPGPCPLMRDTNETIQHFSTRVITCAAGAWTVPGGADRAICIAARESGLNPKASSPTGAYLGLYQHSATYWPSRYDEWTKVDWDLRRSAFNARTNAIVTIRMVHDIGRWVKAGWPVKDC